MKLSEAIRLGAMVTAPTIGVTARVIRKPGWRGLFRRETEQATCALGAAFIAAGCGTRPVAPGHQYSDTFRGEAMGDTAVVVPEEWNFLGAVHPCPACSVVAGQQLARVIAHLNDDHRWTREQIADWVETIEAQQALVPIPEDAQQKVTA